MLAGGLFDRVGDRARLDVGSPRHDDEGVGERRLCSDMELDEIFALFLQRRIRHKLE